MELVTNILSHKPKEVSMPNMPDGDHYHLAISAQTPNGSFYRHPPARIASSKKARNRQRTKEAKFLMKQIPLDSRSPHQQ